MLNAASREHLRGLEEVALNIVKQTVPLSESQVRICQRWRKPLRLLGLRKYPLKDKRAILQQGGFFGALLPVIASILGTVIASNS